MALEIKQLLQKLAAIDFAGRGEAFVESDFLTPLLSALGYEAHDDYDTLRHGDDGASFKLKYPPVEAGAQKVKHYNPDYIPRIRKKMFWVIEAKSPKDVSYPFAEKYLVQGLQYCIHPEIQAKYLVVSNGTDTALYDAHSSVFFGMDIYEPILTFKSTELVDRWPRIWKLLSVETLRERIEVDMKAMYDKLCLSSLDKSYPQRLLQKIGVQAGEHSQSIEKHVNTLYVQKMDRDQKHWLAEMAQLDAEALFQLMDSPMQGGPRQNAHFFVQNSLAAGTPEQTLFDRLAASFESGGIFRKQQSWLGLIDLWTRTKNDGIKKLCQEYFWRYGDAELPLITQVECAHLRVMRKITVVNIYPPLRQRLQQELATAPELTRFVGPPSAFSMMFDLEIHENRQWLATLRGFTEDRLKQELARMLEVEQKVDPDFQSVRPNLPMAERQIGGFEGYGLGGKHYFFKNTLAERGINT
jgi:hypothetical protein